jgi:hypothetical protein
VQLGSIARSVSSSPVLLLSVLFLFFAGSAQARSLYNVDFEAPVHTVGANPTLGQGPAPRKTPTEIFQSSPVVVAQPGVLDGQSLRFTPSSDYRQIKFGVGSKSAGFPEQYPQCRFRGDLVFNNKIDNGHFRVLVDAPNANRLDFEKGRMAVAVAPTLWTSTDVGAFNVGERLALDIFVDRSAEWWSIRVNGMQIHQGPFYYTDYPPNSGFQTLRFSSVGSADVYLDNVRIEGLPEPGTLTLAAAAGVLLLRRRRG